MTVNKSIIAVFAAGSLLFAAQTIGVNSVRGGSPAVHTAIVCTTTQLSAIVDAVGGGRFETHTIIPYGMCPGHFDLTPGEAQKLQEAPLLLYHGYEQFIKGVKPGDKTHTQQITVPGNWMIPGLHAKAVQEITPILSGLQPAHTDEFTARAATYSAMIMEAADSLQTALFPLRGMPVVCAGMNRDFAAWMGLRVIADFPRDEDISVKDIRDILAECRKQGARLVIDNMQSGGKIGQTIAENMDIPLVILTNFPETGVPVSSGYPYIRTLTENCSSVVKALERSDRNRQTNMQ
jgi:zinc transport system substrate-binding protein